MGPLYNRYCQCIIKDKCHRSLRSHFLLIGKLRITVYNSMSGAKAALVEGLWYLIFNTLLHFNQVTEEVVVSLATTCKGRTV